MNITFIIFLILAVGMVVCSILAVTTSRILRAATYLLFVLFGTAGIYFMLNYTFLGAVQLLVYAGGITILYVFSILLTSSQDERAEKLKSSRIFPGLITIVAGLAICLFLILKNQFVAPVFEKGEVPMSVIGQALMGAGKHQYVLPFEVISILLLACIVGGLLIARKR